MSESGYLKLAMIVAATIIIAVIADCEGKTKGSKSSSVTTTIESKK